MLENFKKVEYCSIFRMEKGYTVGGDFFQVAIEGVLPTIYNITSGSEKNFECKAFKNTLVVWLK